MEAVVEVFKTDVPDEQSARQVLAQLLQRFPEYRINFDLDDCDKVLRMEGESISTDAVTEVLEKEGFWCEVME